MTAEKIIRNGIEDLRSNFYCLEWSNDKGTPVVLCTILSFDKLMRYDELNKTSKTFTNNLKDYHFYSYIQNYAFNFPWYYHINETCTVTIKILTNEVGPSWPNHGNTYIEGGIIPPYAGKFTAINIFVPI